MIQFFQMKVIFITKSCPDVLSSQTDRTVKQFFESRKGFDGVDFAVRNKFSYYIRDHSQFFSWQTCTIYLVSIWSLWLWEWLSNAWVNGNLHFQVLTSPYWEFFQKLVSSNPFRFEEYQSSALVWTFIGSIGLVSFS